MARVIYVLGAGFNCSVLDPSARRDAPLARNFFQVLLKSRRPEWLDSIRRHLFVDQLLDEIDRLWKINLEALASTPFDIEECLTLFESRLKDNLLPADILFIHANLVPVGKDQLPHVELTRSIARRFNERYCQYSPFFPLPEALLGQAPLLLGVDGRKMGKSLGNAIYISSSADETAALVRRAVTDTERHISYDPIKRPEVANLLTLAALCQESTPEKVAEEVGNKGAAELKRVVSESVNGYFAPIRKKRAELAKDRGAILEVLRTGNDKARSIATQTLDNVRTAMGMRYY